MASEKLPLKSPAACSARPATWRSSTRATFVYRRGDEFTMAVNPGLTPRTADIAVRLAHGQVQLHDLPRLNLAIRIVPVTADSGVCQINHALRPPLRPQMQPPVRQQVQRTSSRTSARNAA